MRLALVQGKVVLSSATPELVGTTLLVVEPVTAGNLKLGTKSGGGKSLVAADRLGANLGQLVGVVEGREAANPFWPDSVPVDAYCSLIVDSIDFRPPTAEN